jgi:hypothetical protein
VDTDQAQIMQQILGAFFAILQQAMPNISLDRAIKIKQHTLHRWLYADCETYLDHVFFYDQEL